MVKTKTKKAVRRPGMARQIRERLRKNPEISPHEIASDLDCHVSMVYRTRRRMASTKPSGTVKVKKTLRTPPVSVSVRVSLVPVLVQVRDEHDHLLGTLKVTDKGVQYRKSNAKGFGDRHLSWDVLDKLMSLGLV